MKRWQFILWVAALVIPPVALAALFQVENWRGARAWKMVEHDLAVRNEPFDLAAVLPLPVPDEQNLAKAPVVVRAVNGGYVSSSSTGPVAWSDMPNGRDDRQTKFSRAGWTTAYPLPLADWQKHYAGSKQCPHPARPGTPSADVLLALTIFAPLLDEMVRETETRAQAIASVDWEQEPATNIRYLTSSVYLKAVTTLRLRACAELAEGQHERALRDTLAALRLCDAFGRIPTFVGVLENRSSTLSALQPVWEGLAARRWTADELRQIGEALRRDDELEDYVRAMRGDRILGCAALESMRKSSRYGEAFFDGGGRPVAPIYEWSARAITVAPRGWVDQNKTSISRLYQGFIDAVDLRTRRISLEKQAAASAQVNAMGKKPFLVYTLFARFVLPGADYLLPLAARMQMACEQAQVACALERYYLDHQAYPDTLIALVPGYLERVPNDLMDGAPMRYRRMGDGRYLLYSIGWNGRDDGGAVAWKSGTPSEPPDRPDDNEGDWVWQYTPLNPPTGRP